MDSIAPVVDSGAPKGTAVHAERIAALLREQYDALMGGELPPEIGALVARLDGRAVAAPLAAQLDQ